MRADGTILDLVPIGKLIAIIGALLVALFTVTKPEASNGLGPLGRLLFWSMHTGLGLGALWLAGRWLARGERLPTGTLPAVLLTGCAAILIAAPGYLALDALFDPYLIDLDPDPPRALPALLIAEIIELAPWFMIAWIIINLPVLLPRPIGGVNMDDTVIHGADSGSLTKPATEASPNSSSLPAALQAVVPGTSGARSPQREDTRQQKFLLSLPGVIGTDVIAVCK